LNVELAKLFIILENPQLFNYLFQGLQVIR
jgi:hypothetical protein